MTEPLDEVVLPLDEMNDDQGKTPKEKRHVGRSLFLSSLYLNGMTSGLKLGDWGSTPVWAKSLTPGFDIINHYQMVTSIRIDCCAET